MTRYRFTDAPMPCGKRMVELTSAEPQPKPASRPHPPRAYRSLRALRELTDELNEAGLRQDRNRVRGTPRTEDIAEYSRIQAQLEQAKQRLDEVRFFWEDSRSVRPLSVRLAALNKKHSEFWRRK